MSRLPSDSGIAIGPILFVIAILGVLAVAMSSSIGSFGTAGTADRVSADIASQANLIRTKINECNLMYGKVDNWDGYPRADSATLVSDLVCTGDNDATRTMWNGRRQTMFPPPTAGFNQWYYINDGAAGGRCFWTTPKSGKSNGGIVSGLTLASNKFSDDELEYDSTSTTQKFVVFVTLPDGTGTTNSNCTVP